MVRRDPHDVLGVQHGTDQPAIKAAWRRLARRHHPDLTGDDPAASRVATRKMAEINDAYAALTRLDPAGNGEGTARRRGGPPRPRPTRPVTGRVDMSGTYRARNETTHGGRGSPLTGHPPIRGERVRPDPLRASDPNGPLERTRVRDFRPPRAPSLRDATEHGLEFGKFHGHTLGEVAGFEPSYIDWLVRTVTRDPDLVAAARVVQRDLDRRGISRGRAATPTAPVRSA
jgi:curved DNA-binding protein CbpA